MKYLVILMLFLSCDFSKHDRKNSDSKLPDQNSTLLGIDTDNDGIRDDVQSLIETKYAAQPIVKQAAKQYARAHQKTFLLIDNKVASIEATKDLFKASDCLLDTLKDSGLTVEQSFKEYKELQTLHNNTKERILAEEKLSEDFDGSSYTLKSKTEACTF